jgi:DNA-binding XRE family transcriptional regulator
MKKKREVVFNMTGGKSIFTRRKELGISQKTLAKKIGISPAALCKIEHDTLRPSDILLIKIKESLSLDDMNGNTQADNSGIMMLEILEKQVTDMITELTDIQHTLKHLKSMMEET